VKPPFTAEAGAVSEHDEEDDGNSPAWLENLEPALKSVKVVEADKLAPALGSLKIPDEAGMSTRRSAHHSSAPPVATSLVKEEPAKSKTVVSKKGLKPAAIKGQGKKRKVVEISDSSSDEKPSKKRPLKRRGGQGSLGGIGEAIMRASEASLTGRALSHPSGRRTRSWSGRAAGRSGASANGSRMRTASCSRSDSAGW
jgi:hypothetical protein